MSEKNSRWSRLELLKALSLYASLTPDRKGNPSKSDLEALASALGRSYASASLRISNIKALDPKITISGVKGMTAGGSEIDEIWQECCDEQGFLSQAKVLRAIAFC
jgi:hypothetical protein